MTSRRGLPDGDGDGDADGAGGKAQASAKVASEKIGDRRTDTKPLGGNANEDMESEKRNNSALVKKNMEAEAATKIQASFRGYQVRKQLKNRVSFRFRNESRLLSEYFGSRAVCDLFITQNKVCTDFQCQNRRYLLALLYNFSKISYLRF